MLRTLLIGSLIAAGACEDRVADKTEAAAERVTKSSTHLRHERHELSKEVAERADERAETGDLTANADDIAGAVRDVSREAGNLAEAQRAYEGLKALRVSSLQAVHAIAAAQPRMIEAVAAAKSLSPAMRARLADNLRIFHQQLEETRRAIDDLAFVTADEWERRDDALGRQMAAMHLARDASWQVLDDNHRDEPFPGT